MSSFDLKVGAKAYKLKSRPSSQSVEPKQVIQLIQDIIDKIEKSSLVLENEQVLLLALLQLGEVHLDAKAKTIAYKRNIEELFHAAKSIQRRVQKNPSQIAQTGA